MTRTDDRRAAVGRALTLHATTGLIRSWYPTPPNVATVTATGGRAIELRTVREAEVFCAALASAAKAVIPVRKSRRGGAARLTG